MLLRIDFMAALEGADPASDPSFHPAPSFRFTAYEVHDEVPGKADTGKKMVPLGPEIKTSAVLMSAPAKDC